MDLINSLPPAFWVWVASFGGSTVHALRNRKVPAKEGIVGVYCSLLVGGFAVFAICWFKSIPVDEIWWSGFFMAFLGNYLMGGMEAEGRKLQRSLVGRIVELLQAWAAKPSISSDATITKNQS